MNYKQYLAISFSSILVRVASTYLFDINLIIICIIIMIPITLIPKIEKYQSLCYAGSFLGMGRGIDLSFFLSIILLSLVYRLQQNIKINAGGKLGFLAYISNQASKIRW